MRFLMLISLALWLGGIVFFGAVMAPALFSTLPTTELVGQVVSKTLTRLHYIGLACGLVFLAASMLWMKKSRGYFKPLAAGNVLVFAMLLLTAISQFYITPTMHALRAEVGMFEKVSQDDAGRQRFNALHQWSTRLEGGVLLLGLGALYLTSRRLS